MSGPIMSDGVDFDKKLLCHFKEYKCDHLKIYDGHYFYCSIQEDSAPLLRKNCGKQLISDSPNQTCPYLRKEEE